jgi:2-octaprenyl-6-methoxyphenol hydroxylase
MPLAEVIHKTPNPTLSLDYDIAIVGGGIVGCTLAAALKHSGLRIAIIEAQPLEIAAAKRQAYALNLLSGRIFQGIGVWAKILPQISKFSKIRLSDADYQGVVEFETKDLGTEYLGYVAEHGIVLGELQAFLRNDRQVTWFCPAKVTGINYSSSQAEITLEIDGETKILNTQLVVAADGSRSQIRQWAGIVTRGWKYWQSCVTFSVKHEAPKNNTAFERFWSTGPMGVLPLSGNRCQIVWTVPHAEAKCLQEMDEREFLSKLEHYTGGLLGRLEMASSRFLFPVQLMQSSRYIMSRLALVGDAAHCCHPVGGQGLNLGIRDAASLAQVIIRGREQQQDIGSIAVLKNYEKWRKKENLGILALTDLLDRLFSNNWLAIVFLRRIGLHLMSIFPPMKIFALKLMVGFKGKIPILGSNFISERML